MIALLSYPWFVRLNVGNDRPVMGRYCGDRLRPRLLRGGAWNNNVNYVRAAVRNRNNVDNRNNNVGLRLASHGFLTALPPVAGRFQNSTPVTACVARIESRRSRFLAAQPFPAFSALRGGQG
jgi:hypothetical protein